MSTTTPTATKNVGVVVALLWFAIVLDGFDLVVLGATIPAMLEDPEWHLTAGQATQISTIGLIGMTIGALTIGFLTDRLGRRRVMLFSVAVFSVFTLLLGFTTNIPLFSLWRFLAGVGLGGALPTAIAMVTEFRPGSKAGSASTTLMTGYHVGAVATALLGMFLIEGSGWHAMFIAGAIPGLFLLPLLYFFLPESPQYLKVSGRTKEAEEIAAAYGLTLEDDLDRDHEKELEDSSSLASLFKPSFQRNTLAIWGTSFMGLLLVYGLNTWLPQIMRQADYDLGNSLGFLMVLNIGAVIGLYIAGQVADKHSPRKTALTWFLLSAVFLALLAVRMPLVGLYGIVLLTGVFVFSSQVLIYAFVGENHPAKMRATAMGFSAGIGRLGAISGPLLGGLLVGANLAYPWGFFAFAAVGVLGALIFSFSKTLRNRDA
ncbi:major facilitator superfamily permease [Corynebacterium deserti GIMN1.010]|uniref:Major facilitator superfamily permease n=1 Tax=Corynebacterium deserti GIMN1.010 TaxID=931089 RepID=A0A0M4CIR0_9CORY|nr:aromatic acid/H+ symport family MFS transporter [Corynebacterium deserti]ALC05476.1 major facilitator superfamily permease [Corynebacterium deserti GIMN1.010]